MNNQIALYFSKLYRNGTINNLIFHDKSDLNSFYKIRFLNNLYSQEKFRFFYLDINYLNKLKETNEKRKYLSYYIARIYNHKEEFKADLGNFLTENLRHIR